MKSGTRYVEERSRPVTIAVIVEADASDALIEMVRQELRPFTAAAALQIEVAEPGKTPALVAGTETVIALAGSGTAGLHEALAGPRHARVPVVVVALGDEAASGQLADVLGQPTADLIVRADAEVAVQRLGAWLVDNMGSKRLALAHNFAFMRRAVAEDAVKNTAWQNGLIGLVTPVPGADMPLMTANQIKMLLQIAAAYGQPLNVERVKELGAVVAGGYLMRTVARQALVAWPVVGWAIKGGIGYTGTMAMGKATISYFEQGADLTQVTEYLRSVRDKASKRAFKKAPVAVPPAYTPVLPAGEHPQLPVDASDVAGD